MSISSVPDPQAATESIARAERASRSRDEGDDAAEIRYSLTALGEALVADRARTRFRGFGPCPVAKIAG